MSNVAFQEARNPVLDDLSPDELATIEDIERENEELTAKATGERFDLDPEAERKIAAHVVMDPEIMEWSLDLIKPGYFTAESHQLLVGTAQRLYRETGVMPTRDVIDIEIREKTRDRKPEEQHRVLTDIGVVCTYLYCLDEREFVKRWVVKFATDAAAKRAVFDYVGKHRDLGKLKEELAGIEEDDPGKKRLPEIEDCCGFSARAVAMPKQIVVGCLHQGSKLSVGGGSKSFKTWALALDGSHAAGGTADVPMALMLWTGEMLKAGYPSLRKGIPAAYDPMSTVTIPLTADEWQAILSQPGIAKTKKFRPRLEAVAETGQAADLSIDEWGRIMLALCGTRANREPGVRKHLLMLAGKIATSLSEVLPIDCPPWAGGRWKDE